MSSRRRTRKTRSNPKEKQTKSQNKPTKKTQRPRRIRRWRIPAAFTATFQSSSSIKTDSSGAATLRCREIFAIEAQAEGASFMLPITPTKWAGTRTAVLASTYSSHRPLSISVKWEPMVGTSTSGSVAFGTVFAGVRLPSSTDTYVNLSRSLAATNGGFVSTIWDHHSSNVALGRNLRANQFPLYEVSADDIPLWLVLSSSVTAGPIGYLVVDAVFTLRNPLSGQSTPPITATATASFTHSNESNQTTMSVPRSAFNRVVEVGQNLAFAFARNLISVAGGVVNQILSPLIASYLRTENDNYVFSVDNVIATQNALSYVIGLAPNF